MRAPSLDGVSHLLVLGMAPAQRLVVGPLYVELETIDVKATLKTTDGDVVHQSRRSATDGRHSSAPESFVLENATITVDEEGVALAIDGTSSVYPELTLWSCDSDLWLSSPSPSYDALRKSYPTIAARILEEPSAGNVMGLALDEEGLPSILSYENGTISAGGQCWTVDENPYAALGTSQGLVVFEEIPGKLSKMFFYASNSRMTPCTVVD